MPQIITIAIYGDFEKKDIRTRIMINNGEQYRFQNMLISAGYDCILESLSIKEIEEAIENQK